MRIEPRSALLGCVLYLYPRGFRTEFGAEMLEVFADRRATVRGSEGSIGVIRLWARTLLDVFLAAGAERLAPDPPRRPTLIPPRRHLAGLESSVLDRLLQDLRYATRLLRKSPGFTIAVILTLVVGIGANTATFSLVNGLLLRPLPLIERPDRLVAVYTSVGDDLGGVSSYMDYRDFRVRMESVARLAAYKPRLADLSTGDSVERVQAMLVSGNYFEVLGIEPAAGRLLTPQDDLEPDAHAVAAISHGLWTRRFGGDPTIVNRSVRINGREFTVVGVTPAGFRGTWLESGPDVYVPMMMQAHMMPGNGNLLDRRSWGGILVLGRLAEGRSIEQARAELDSAGAWIIDTYPDEAGWRQYRMRPFDEGTLLPEVRGVVVRLSWLLMGTVGLVLMVACVNVANLLLARATTRKREIALR